MGTGVREPELVPDTVGEAVANLGVPEVVGDAGAEKDTAKLWDRRGLREAEGEPLVVLLTEALRDDEGEREALEVAQGDGE